MSAFRKQAERFNTRFLDGNVVKADLSKRPFTLELANGKTPDGKAMVAINVRCLDGIDVAKLKTKPFDGKSK